MTKTISLLLCLTAVLILSWQAEPIWGQTSGGSISGTVRDESGAVLPGVTVTIRHVEMGVACQVIADDEGRYRAPELAVGSYEIQAELAALQGQPPPPARFNLG